MKLIKLTRKYNGRTVYVDPNTVCMVSESEPTDGVSENPSRSWIMTTYKEIIEVTETAEEVARMVQESTETREKPNTIDADNFATTDMETFRQGMAAIASKFI